MIRETPSGLDAGRFDEYVTEFRRQAGALATDAGLSPVEQTELDGERARRWGYESRRPEEPRTRQQQVVVIHATSTSSISFAQAGVPAERRTLTAAARA